MEKTAKEKKPKFPWWEKRQKALNKNRSSYSQYLALGNPKGKSNADSSPVKWKEHVYKGENSVKLSSQQEYVLDLIRQGKNVFYTGNAGTGKTTLLREIQKCAPEGTYVTALTGVAAVQAGGITLHSYAGIGLGNGTKEHLFGIVLRSKKAQNWRNTNVLIIDEVSMLDGKLFDKLEYIARKIRHCEKPFGGIQLVLCGDFFQLPPIQKVGETSVNYCFQSTTWTNVLEHSLELTQIYRQSDPKLIKLLNEIRYQSVSPESLDLLNYLKRSLSCSDIEPTKLYSHNASVNDINNRKLQCLHGEEKVYLAKDFGQSPYKENLSKYVIAMEKLVLKIGAQVILLKNLTEELINGSRGVVESFDEDGWPKVKFSDGQLKSICLVDWNLENSRGIVLARRTQVPLKLAWAITIHKSQGMSIDLLQVDLNKVFTQGQAYVALSRARTLEGLQVLTFDETKFMTSDAVIKFYREKIQKAPEQLGAKSLQDVSPSCSTQQQEAILTTPSKKRMREEKAGNSAKKRISPSFSSTTESNNLNAKHTKRENMNSQAENYPKLGSSPRTLCVKKGFQKASELYSSYSDQKKEDTQPLVIEATDEECLQASPTPSCQLVVKRKRSKQSSLFKSSLNAREGENALISNAKSLTSGKLDDSLSTCSRLDSYQNDSSWKTGAGGKKNVSTGNTHPCGGQDGPSWNTELGGKQMDSTCNAYPVGRQNGPSWNTQSTDGIKANVTAVHYNTESDKRRPRLRASGSPYEGNCKFEAKVKRQREKSKRKCSVLFDVLKSDESNNPEEVVNKTSLEERSTPEDNRQANKRQRKGTKRKSNLQVIGDENPFMEVPSTKVTKNDANVKQKASCLQEKLNGSAVSMDDVNRTPSIHESYFLKNDQSLSLDIEVACERSRERSKINCSKLFDALKEEDTPTSNFGLRTSKGQLRKDALSPINFADNHFDLEISAQDAITQTEYSQSHRLSNHEVVADDDTFTHTDTLGHQCNYDAPKEKTDKFPMHFSSTSRGMCAFTQPDAGSSYQSTRFTIDFSEIILQFKIPSVSILISHLNKMINIMFFLASLISSISVQVFYNQFQD